MEHLRRRPNIADVAREAGVSKTAVSFAFNSPERLSPGTAARIRAVADGLGYRPHPVARMLSQRRTWTLGILTSQALSVVFARPAFATFSAGVAVAAEEAGYGLLFVSPVHGSLARAVARATVDGFVAIGLAEEHPEVGQIRGAGLPIVLADTNAFWVGTAADVDDGAGRGLAEPDALALRREGEAACRRLLAAIERRDAASSDHRHLEARRIVRRPSGAAPRTRRLAAENTD